MSRHHERAHHNLGVEQLETISEAQREEAEDWFELMVAIGIFKETARGTFDVADLYRYGYGMTRTAQSLSRAAPR
jgi:hypothetical protein